jgi:hypothetical protein
MSTLTYLRYWSSVPHLEAVPRVAARAVDRRWKCVICTQTSSHLFTTEHPINPSLQSTRLFLSNVCSQSYSSSVSTVITLLSEQALGSIGCAVINATIWKTIFGRRYSDYATVWTSFGFHCDTAITLQSEQALGVIGCAVITLRSEQQAFSFIAGTVITLRPEELAGRLYHFVFHFDMFCVKWSLCETAAADWQEV